MGVQKKEHNRKEREGKTGDGMGNVKTKGQIIIEAAANNYTIPAFKVEKQAGAVRYFTAQVSKFIENLGTSNDTVKGAFTLLRQTDTLTA